MTSLTVIADPYLRAFMVLSPAFRVLVPTELDTPHQLIFQC